MPSHSHLRTHTLNFALALSLAFSALPGALAQQPAAHRPAPAAATPPPAPLFDGQRAFDYAAKFVAIGPRWPSSPGHAKAEAFLKQQFAHDNLEADHFAPNTPIGPVAMTNYIVRFPGKRDGVIVLSTHYETNYPLRNIGYVGANDGGSTTGLLIEMANRLRGKPLDGESVWLVFFDGEEAFDKWSASDSDYGSRHLASKWQADGTLKKLKAFILLDMIGDKDLNIVRDQNSTPWLLDLVQKAATRYNFQRYFFATTNQIEDDHLPFMQRGVPCADLIDFDYGPKSFMHPEGYHHTAQDTMDKVSAHSLTVVGSTVQETIRLLNLR